MKIQISRNDIYQMVNEAVQRINEQLEEDLTNPAQRIAVVKNIYAKHHKEDPSFTWQDAVDWYIQKYQSSLEGREDNFTEEDMREELMSYARLKERERGSQADRKSMQMAKFEEDSRTIEEILSNIGGELNVEEIGAGNFPEKKFTVTFETVPFNFEDSSSDYITSIASRCYEAFKELEETDMRLLGYPFHDGLNVYAPGSDGQSRIGYGNSNVLGSIGYNVNVEGLVDRLEQSYGWDKFGPTVKTLTAKLVTTKGVSGYCRMTLYFKGEFDEAGHGIMDKAYQGALASVEHDREMGWSLD